MRILIIIYTLAFPPLFSERSDQDYLAGAMGAYNSFSDEIEVLQKVVKMPNPINHPPNISLCDLGADSSIDVRKRSSSNIYVTVKEQTIMPSRLKMYAKGSEKRRKFRKNSFS